MFQLEEMDLKKMYSWWESTMDNNLIRLQNELKEYFERIDKEIFLSQWRKEKGYISKEVSSRRILTVAGYITFYRRRYKYFDLEAKRWKYVFLADQKLGVDKYKRINSHIKFKILKLIAKGLRYQDIINIIKLKISKMSISNIVNSFNLQDYYSHDYNEIIKKIPVKKCLYIQLDDAFISLRNNRKEKIKYRIRFATIHTGYDEVNSTSSRNVIANKRSFFQLFKVDYKIDTSMFVNKLYEFASKFFDGINNCSVVITGDGAHWIQESSKYWSNSIYVYDKFHAFKKLKNTLIINRSKNNLQSFEIVKSYFNVGDYKNLIQILKSFLSNPEYKNKYVKIRSIIRNFKNNERGIVNQGHELNIGCHIESDISHSIKWLLGYGSKAFNYKTFYNMISLKTREMNKIDLLVSVEKLTLKLKENLKNYYWNYPGVKT